MQLSETQYPDGRPVDGYGPGFFRIAGEVFKGAIAVLPNAVFSWHGYEDVETILNVASDLDVIFVGTGEQLTPIPASFRDPLEAAGVGVEIMNTPTACRTFNVLLSEGRRVGLALIPV